MLLNKALRNMQKVFLTVGIETSSGRADERKEESFAGPWGRKDLSLLSVCFLKSWEDPRGKRLPTAMTETEPQSPHRV